VPPIQQTDALHEVLGSLGDVRAGARRVGLKSRAFAIETGAFYSRAAVLRGVG